MFLHQNANLNTFRFSIFLKMKIRNLKYPKIFICLDVVQLSKEEFMIVADIRKLSVKFLN